MNDVLYVDVWSDVVCPFCYLGLRQLQGALATFEHSRDVVVRHHAFELDPGAPRAYDGTLDEMLAAKYAMTIEQAAGVNQRVVDSARELGMDWSLSRARPANTFDAHRVIALAETHDRRSQMLERLFRAYFSEGLLISDHETLSALADEVGVPGAAQMLASDTSFAEEVRSDEALAATIGITGVPAFIFHGRHHVSGAQGSDALRRALEAAWSEIATLAAPS